MTQATSAQIDPRETAKFAALAEHWWQPDGPMAGLHRMNPARLGYIRDHAVRHFRLDPGTVRTLQGLRVLDIGCGAGLLSLPLARMGAQVTGLDATGEALEAAKAKAVSEGLTVTFKSGTAADLAARKTRYDIVCALEVVEHVPAPAAFLADCARLVRPGGLVFVSTLNKTALSFALGIVAAEYLLGLVARGTHDWRRFLPPAEVAAGLRGGGVETIDSCGLVPDLASGGFRLDRRRLGVNYILCGSKPG